MLMFRTERIAFSILRVALIWKYHCRPLLSEKRSTVQTYGRQQRRLDCSPNRRRSGGSGGGLNLPRQEPEMEIRCIQSMMHAEADDITSPANNGN